MQKSVTFVKNNFKMNMLKIKSILKLGTIVLKQVNIKVLLIAYVVLSIVYLKKLL